GDDAVGGDLLHGLGDQAADLRVARRDGAHAGDVVAVLDLLAVALDGLHSSGDSLAHAAADVHGVGAGGHVLHAFGDHSLGQDGGGGGAVAGGVVGLGCDFLHQLGAHVLKRVLQLDLLGDGHAVVGDDGCAVLLVQHDVAALGAQGDLDGVGQRINAGAKCLAGVLALFDLFCHKVSLLFLLYMRRLACRGMVRSCSGRAAYSSTMARMSLWRTMVHSSPSTLTSVPEYLLVSTLSPTFTVMVTSLPSTMPPGPTARTSATWGFSLALPVRMMPLLVVSSASTVLMTTRSARGIIFIILALL